MVTCNCPECTHGHVNTHSFTSAAIRMACTTLAEVLHNFHSISMGVGALNYPNAWWNPPLKHVIRQLHLSAHIYLPLWYS